MILASGLWELVEARAAATPHALLAVDEADRELSFEGYRAAALRCAAALAQRDVGPGSVVSWMLPTRLESLVLAGALARLGAVQNPVLPLYRRRELGFVTRQAQTQLLVVPGMWRGFDYEGMARELGAERPRMELLVAGDALPEAEPELLPPRRAGDPAALRWLFYTSGTTADPKGAKHSDASLLAAARALCGALELAADDRVALVFPLTHVGGIVWLFAGLLAGCCHIVVSAFDNEASIDVLARHGVTQAAAGTAFHQAYLAAQRRRPAAPIFPRVRAFPGGGAPKPPGLHADVKRELGGAGVVSGYGMTECPIVTMGSVRDPDAKLALTEGRPTPGAQVRIVGPDGAVLPAGAEGEIQVRGPQLCQGYLDAKLDHDAFAAQGWLRTGDLGRLDADGYLIVTGRLKDVIVRKGECISAREVEDLLHVHPKVAECAVVGVPDAERGERACAVIVARAAQEPLGFEEMVSFLKRQGLMLQKIPEQLVLVQALPRNASGKVLKQALRERLSAAGDPPGAASAPGA